MAATLNPGDQCEQHQGRDEHQVLGWAVRFDLKVDDLPIEIQPDVLCGTAEHDVVGVHLAIFDAHFQARIGEALELRRAGIDAPVLIFGYTSPERAEELLGECQDLGVVAAGIPFRYVAPGLEEGEGLGGGMDRQRLDPAGERPSAADAVADNVGAHSFVLGPAHDPSTIDLGAARAILEVDGAEVPVVRLDISSVSHPFWTGTARELDADGKIDRFRRRYGGGKK